MPDSDIRLLLADVDGTLVTPDKTLTQRTIDAVTALHAAGVLFAITSGRPPRGMSMLVEPLQLTMPISAFNGGLIVEPDLTVLEQRLVPETLVKPILTLLESHGLDTWIYRGAEWYVRDPKGPHVDREATTVRFQPTVVTTFDDLCDRVAKVVGVSDDRDAMARATRAAREQFSHDVTAAQSQPYYLDVTHPAANKGEVVKFLSSRVRHPHVPGRHDRGHAERRLDVRPLRAQHRDGERVERSAAGRPDGHDQRPGRGLRQRRRAVRPASGRDPPVGGRRSLRSGRDRTNRGIVWSPRANWIRGVRPPRGPIGGSRHRWTTSLVQPDFDSSVRDPSRGA